MIQQNPATTGTLKGRNGIHYKTKAFLHLKLLEMKPVLFMFTGGATLCLEGIVLYSQQLLKYMKYML